MFKRLKWAHFLVLALVTLGACQPSQPDQPTQTGSPQELSVESSAFGAAQAIPKQYTCDGADLSPPLSWSEPPAGTASLALIADDPDAPGGTWVHWVLFNIPATSRSLSEGVPGNEVVEGAGVHGSNSWRRIGYGGPCPPQGPAHRYVFTLYALDTVLDLQPGASKEDVEKAMQGHILAQGQLTGQYGR